MKKHIIFICLFLSVLVLHAKAIQEDFKNADEKARMSYAFGMLLGLNFGTLPLEFDYDAFTEGFKNIVEGTETHLSEQEAIEIVETAIQEIMEKEANENRQREADFLTANMQRPGIQVTQSGLQYEILAEGDGEKPDHNSIVRVNYTGVFIDGTMFDSSDEDEGAYIPLEMVIPGWTEGLMLMNTGSTYRLYVPSNLAYGRNGMQNVIPPYSTLIFTVELLEILNYDDSDFYY
jgi:FKBP-type peptidyl-prolyl cis-trans isomerase